MIRGLYTSGLGMTVQMQKLDVISNNIANVNTTGYKNDTSVTQSFSEELTRRLGAGETPLGRMMGSGNVGSMSQGLFIDHLKTDFSMGTLTNTEGALDLAINGSGFFSVRTADGAEYFSRDGSLTVSDERVLMSKEGNVVLGLNGQITIPDGTITIDTGGQIYVDGEYIDTLRLTDFEDLTALRKIGSGLYTATDNTGQTAFTGTVEQGFLEGSNVNPVREMVEMINVTRAYEANQRMVVTHDTILGKAVSDIARK